MKLLRLIGYFSQLRMLLGFRSACIFALTHLRNKLYPPRGGKLASIPVGPHVFYFPSVVYFEGIFSEIFFRETYYLESTQAPIRVIDCGANIGLSLLYIKIRVPHAQVLCFEPNPAAFAVLKQNIVANNWGDAVKAFPFALGKKKGSVDFYIDGGVASGSGGSTARFQKNKNQHLTSYPVEMDTLSHYISDNVDFLKIDIEGGEFDLLEELVNAEKLPFVQAVQLEYHFVPGVQTRPLSDMLALLESGGFRTATTSNVAPHQIIGRDTWHTHMVFAWRP